MLHCYMLQCNRVAYLHWHWQALSSSATSAQTAQSRRFCPIQSILTFPTLSFHWNVSFLALAQKYQLTTLSWFYTFFGILLIGLWLWILKDAQCSHVSDLLVGKATNSLQNKVCAEKLSNCSWDPCNLQWVIMCELNMHQSVHDSPPSGSH